MCNRPTLCRKLQTKQAKRRFDPVGPNVIDNEPARFCSHTNGLCLLFLRPLKSSRKTAQTPCPNIIFGKKGKRVWHTHS